MLHAVEIESNRFEDIDRSIETLNIKRIEARDIVNLPGAMDDPIRAAQIYSGAGGGGDFTSFLTTRGSSPAQNQVVMDGIAIPNPYRMRIAMGGGLSIFNPQTIDDVHLHLGGYSAEYGNALSSVLAVTTREGSRDKSRYSLSLNLTDLNGVAEGALQNGKGSYLISLRRTYFDLLASGFASKGSVLPFSQEISGKLTYNFSPAHQLQVSILNNNEQMKLLAGSENPADFNSTEEAKLAFANAVFRSVLRNRFIVKAQIAAFKDRTNFHTYRNINEEDNEFAVQDVFSENYRLNLKQTAFWQIDSTKSLHLGTTWIQDNTEADFALRAGWMHNARTEYPTFAQYNSRSWLSENFAEATAHFNYGTQLRLGTRYDYSQAMQEGHWDYRANAIQSLGHHLRLKASWGTIHQFPNYTTIYTHEFPLNLGGALDTLNAEKSTQRMLGLETDYVPGYRIKFDMYKAQIEDMLLPDEWNLNLPTNSAEARSQGFEFIVEKYWGEKITGLLSFSGGRSEYRKVGDSEWTISKYSLARGLTLLTNYKINQGWSSSLLWRYASGLPYTDFRGTMLRHFNSDLAVLDGRYILTFITDERNNASFPAYKRLDARISYRRKSGKWNMHFYLDLINMLNHKNLYEIIWSISNGTGDQHEQLTANRHELFMLPFLPSIGITVNF